MNKVSLTSLFLGILLSLSGCEICSQPDGGDGYAEQQTDANCCAVKIIECDFSKDKVWHVINQSEDTVALITLEYLGKALSKQAILIYTRDRNRHWRTDSVFVASVTLEQSGSAYSTPSECCSGGTVKYYPSDEAWFYNDITQAVKDAYDTVYIKTEADGSTTLKEFAVTDQKAALIPMRLNFGGYEYPIVKIAGHFWTAENIRTTDFPSGDDISQTASWSSRNARFGFSSNMNAGCLYNHYAATQLSQGKWRLPTGGTSGDWSVLVNFISGAADVLYAKNNVTGLSVVPSGRITPAGESYEPDYDDCIFWSSTSVNETKAYFTKVYHKTVGDLVQYTSSTDMRSGFAVRLIRKF